MLPVICVSGGFDPIHKGHVRLFKEAVEYGWLTVILNSDDWLMRKKGYVFMPWNDRREILKAMIDVDSIEPVDDSDGTVCEALERLRPGFFANGGDRTSDNTPELELCKRLNIVPLFNMGGGKVASSRELLRNVDNQRGNTSV